MTSPGFDSPGFDEIAQMLLRLRPLTSAERERELGRLLERSPALYEQVRSLLEAAPGSDRLFDQPVVYAESARSLADPSIDDAPHPPVINGYTVLGTLGVGGMGVVYRARQEQPRREVAIKVLHRSIASASVSKRLRREAEVLGRLQHPGIAQIFDAGVDSGAGDRTGLGPYLVMELVQGRTLLRHISANSLSTADRLELFAMICDAVAHAHERSVVHRDIKPDNIIVTPRGLPKILDFGIARITDPEQMASTLHTQAGQVIGTVSYMSPEQIAGNVEQVDARTDVYALGVLLFEMLASRLPFDLGSLPIAEAARIIRDDEPTQLGSVNTHYRGDLDTIVGRAIEKEPERRYQSAAALARDVRRHLANEPIRARPASRTYRIKKFTRRNRVLVLGVASTIAVLTIGIIASLAFAFYGFHQESIALAATQESERARYRLSVNLASEQIADDYQDRARETLLSAPEALRDWEWHHLWYRLDPMFPIQRDGPRNRAASAAVRADGTWLFAADDGAGYRVVNADSMEEISVLQDSNGTGSMRFNPSGTHLIGRVNGRVVIWDAATGQRSWVSEPTTWSPDMLSPDASTFTAFEYSANKNEWAWSVRTTAGGALTQHHPGYARWRFSSFSNDGTRVLTQTWFDDMNQTMRMYDTATGDLIAEHEFEGDRKTYARSAWSPTDDRIIVPTTPQEYTLFDASTLTEIRRFEREKSPRHLVGFNGACAFADDRTIVIIEHDRRVIAIDLENGQRTQLRRSDTGRRIQQMSAVGRDGSIAVGDQQWVSLLRVDGSRAVDILSDNAGSMYTIDWHPDSRRLATGSWDETMRLWDTSTGKVLRTVPANPTDGHTDRPSSIRFTEGGAVIEALTFWDLWDKSPSTIHRWDLSSGTVIETQTPSWKHATELLPPGSRIDGEYPGGVANYTGDYRAVGTLGILAAVPSADSAGSEDGTRIYDRRTGKTVCTLPIKHRVLAFDPRDEVIYTGAASGVIESFSVPSGQLLARQTAYTSKIYGFATDPAGRRLAVFGADGGVLLKADSLDVLMRLDGHSSFIRSGRFSPDGRHLATASGDGTIRVWKTHPLQIPPLPN